jgi:hypothetical protein
MLLKRCAEVFVVSNYFAGASAQRRTQECEESQKDDENTNTEERKGEEESRNIKI